MENKVYVVIEEIFQYASNYTNVCGAFRNYDDAIEYAKRLKETYNREKIIDDDEWEKISQELFNFLDTIDDDIDENPYEGGTPEWQEFEDNFTEFINNKYLEIIRNHGYLNLTIEDVKKQREYSLNKDKYVIVKVEILDLK